MAGTLYVVATPIGNLEDITVRALRILREVSLIAAEDTRRTAHLLAHYGITTPMTSLHEHNEHRKTASLLSRLQGGNAIALVSDAGTPTVSDPGGHLIAEAVAAGVRVEAIPGPNAAIAAMSVSGLPENTFMFLGFPPTRSKDRNAWMDRLRSAPGVAVFYEAPHRILRTLAEIQELVGDVPAVIARELTKAHEELVRGPISMILDRGLSTRGEFTVVLDIGQLSNKVPLGGLKKPSPDDIAHELGAMTNSHAKTRRQAIAELAKKYGMTTKEAYRAIEEAKRSGV